MAERAGLQALLRRLGQVTGAAPPTAGSLAVDPSWVSRGRIGLGDASGLALPAAVKQDSVSALRPAGMALG